MTFNIDDIVKATQTDIMTVKQHMATGVCDVSDLYNLSCYIVTQKKSPFHNPVIQKPKHVIYEQEYS